MIYDCAPINDQVSAAYEQLKLIDVQNQIETIVDSQLQYCGGLGAAGLGGLYWSPNSHYFYYTNARVGVPDGCGHWERPVIRFDLPNRQVEKLGGGPRSPDGTKLALWQGRDLVVWELNGTELGRIPAVIPEAELGPIVWAPNSQKLAYLQVAAFCPPAGFSYLVELDLAGLQPVVLLESDAPRFDRLAWDTVDQIRLFDDTGSAWRYTPTTTALEPLEGVLETYTDILSPVATLTPTAPPIVTPPTPAPPEATAPFLKLISHLGGRISAVDGQDSIVYLGNGTELALLDVSDPTRPARLGYVVFPNLVDDVDMAGERAYVQVEGHGLHLVDVSDPVAPVDLGSIDLPQPIKSFGVRDQIAYIVIEDDGVGVFDISDPAQPIELHRLKTDASMLVVTGSYLHLRKPGGVAMFDIADPANPVEVGTYALPGPLQGVVVRDNLAYVVDTAALRLFDISDPANPTELSFYATSAYMDVIYNMPGAGPGCQTTTLIVEGDYAYLDGCDGNQVVDISDPVQPTMVSSFADVIGSFAAVQGPMSLALNGYGYALGRDGLHILDLSHPAAPQTIGTYRTPTWVIGDMVMTNYHAYVAIPDSGLQVIDISNPARPAVVADYPLRAPVPDIRLAVRGSYLYVIDSEALRILDLSNPVAPLEKSSINIPKTQAIDHFQEFTGIAVTENHVYAGSFFGGGPLWVVDVSDPNQPITVDVAYSLPQGTADMVAQDTYVYHIAADGLKILDVSDPSAPAQIGWYANETSPYWSDLAVVDDYAYVGARYPYDLQVIDVSNPAAPVEVGRYNPPGDGRAVIVAGSLAYVLDEYRRVLKMVDISDPANPTKLDFYDLPNPNNFGKVAIANGYIYASIGAAGLYILQPTFPSSSAAASPQTYTDPDLGFSLRYPASWYLFAKDGASLNDGSGRTTLLEREGYLLEIKAQFRPEAPGGCGGILRENAPDHYWHYQVDGIALWRPKVETGLTDGYSDGSLTFASIISPTLLYNETNANGYIGEYTCSPEINDRIFAFTYRLPVSPEEIQVGQYRADILAEMDGILQSIIWGDDD